MTDRIGSLTLPIAPVPDEGNVIDAALDTIRRHLGMSVAYLSEFVDGRSVFRNVSAPGLGHLIEPGDSQNLDDVYCRHILKGRLPELIPDTSLEPICDALPITKAIPIGSHMSIPIRLADGQPYGMFCCLSPEPNPTLNARDLETMRMFAELAARQVQSEYATAREHAAKRHRIEKALEESSFSILVQPIVDLLKMDIAGHEALCRFSGAQARTPDLWFKEAAETGLGAELEIAVIRRALSYLPALPQQTYLSVNVAPATILSPGFFALMKDAELNRVVLEITEHAMIEDYERVLKALKGLRHRGLRVAVDDAGAGHSSLRHIVQLAPEYIKLDMSLTRDIDTDLARRSLVGALVFYTRETSAQIIAEGIETSAELETLKLLGVSRGQGFYLGRPSVAPVETMERRISGQR